MAPASQTAPGWATRAGPRGPSIVNATGRPSASSRRSWTSAFAPPRELDPRAADRIKRNLRIFEQIAEHDQLIQTLRKKQKRLSPKGEKYAEIEREIDRLVAKIAKDIRTIDFSVQTRNRLVDMLKQIDKEFARVALDMRRAQQALDRETNPELIAMQKRRIEKYRERVVELCGKYGRKVATPAEARAILGLKAA